MQDNFLNREKTQAILDSRPRGVDIPTALKELSNQGFTIEGYNDKPVQSAVSNIGSGVKSVLGGIGEGVGGIALSGIQKGGEYLVNKYGSEQMKQNMAVAPTLRQQYQQQMGKEENPSLYGAGQLGGEIMSLAAPVGAIGRLAKTGVEALGAGSKVAKLTQAGTEGAAFTAGQGLQSGEKQSLTDYAINTGLNIAVPGAGMVAKGLGENVAPRIINSLIKPLAKDFAYGKNPGKAVAELVAPANDFDGLISNISSTLDGVGSRIGSVVNQSQNLKQIDLSYTLKAIDEAINDANKTPRTNASLISRLEGVKSDLVDNIQAGIDPQSYKKLIGDLTKWTGNASDDQAVNKALKQTYGSTRQVMDDVLSKELSPEQFAQYKADSEAYGNLLSAKNAAEYRDKINERQNLISFGAKNAGLLTGVMTAVSTGGAGVPAILAGLAGAGIDKALATPAFKTRLASLLSKLAPKDVSTFFDNVPTAKSIFTEQQIKDFTGELKKNTRVNRGMISLNPEDWSSKLKSDIEVAGKTKTIEGKMAIAEDIAQTLSDLGEESRVVTKANVDDIIENGKRVLSQASLEAKKKAMSTPAVKEMQKRFIKNPTTGKLEGSSKKKVADSLEQEAKKYNTPEEFVKAKAITEKLKSEGTKVNSDGTVTLYHTTTPENAKSILSSGIFKGTSAPIGGMTGVKIDKATFFGTDKKWVEDTWGKGSVIEVKVPVQYIRKGAGNTKEVYFEGGLKRSGGVWIPTVKPQSTFYDKLSEIDLIDKSQLTDIWNKAHGK